MLRSLFSLLCVLFLTAPLPLRADFFLWLDGPQRNNPHDPKSALYHPPLLPWQITNSPTITPSITATDTITPTFSSTITLQNTFTDTSTLTPSATPSRTPTASQTLANSATATFTQTATGTSTSTITPSATPTSSNTAQGSATSTSTSTPQDSATSTLTNTPQDTASPSATPTPTETAFQSNTASPTYSFTPQDTASSTLTPSFTATNTPQDTATFSVTPTETAFLSDTASPTFSATPTETAFLSNTVSPTYSVTPQDTASSTFTPSSTATNTPQDTATFSATPSSTNTPQDTATFSVTPSSTASSTATPSPSATASPVTFNGLWYDGETAGALGTDGSGYASSGCGITEMADGTGYGASTHYLRLTVTAAGSWYAAGAWMNESAMPQTRDVSSFSALELWWRIPSGSTPAGNDLRPNIVLVSSSGQSQPVSATAYLDSQTVPGVDTWVHSTIPISAFTGMDLTTIKAISVQPAFGQYNDSGNYTGAVDLDNIQFTHASGLPLRAFNGLYSDFSLLSGATYTGTYWYTTLDTYSPCTTTTSMSYPTSGGKPIDAGGNTLSPMECGHFAGHLGDGGACTNATYAQMASEFVTGSSVDLSNGSFFKTLPTGATGMRFALKLGPNSGAGQVYHVVLTMNAVTQGGADYYVQVAGSSLSTTQFTYFQVPFPANGTNGTPHTYGSSNELWFGQIPWATQVAWDDTGAKAVRVDAATRGADFDIMVDDIELY